MNRRLLERVGGKAVRDGGWRCRELGWWGEVDLGEGGGGGGGAGRRDVTSTGCAQSLTDSEMPGMQRMKSTVVLFFLQALSGINNIDSRVGVYRLLLVVNTYFVSINKS